MTNFIKLIFLQLQYTFFIVFKDVWHGPLTSQVCAYESKISKSDDCHPIDRFISIRGIIQIYIGEKWRRDRGWREAYSLKKYVLMFLDRVDSLNFGIDLKQARWLDASAWTSLESIRVDAGYCILDRAAYLEFLSLFLKGFVLIGAVVSCLAVLSCSPDYLVYAVLFLTFVLFAPGVVMVMELNKFNYLLDSQSELAKSIAVASLPMSSKVSVLIERTRLLRGLPVELEIKKVATAL